MNRRTFIRFTILLLLRVGVWPARAQELRPPAYPLVTIDPYTSVWSFSDQLYDQPTRHWTGKSQGLTGLIRVDGKVYRFLGKTETPAKMLMATSLKTPQPYRYVTQKPADSWTKPTFDARKWKSGKGLLASASEKGSQTSWETADVWVRRSFVLKAVPKNSLRLYIRHDDDVEVYLNGEPAFACAPCFTPEYLEYELSPKAIATLHKGKNVLAVHCKNTAGPGSLDFGLTEQLPVTQEPVAIQKSVKVTATRTEYLMRCGLIDLTLTFNTPLLLNNLETATRPVSYVTFRVQSANDQPHTVQLYFGASAQLAVNQPKQAVEWKRSVSGPLSLLRVGTKEQNVLGTKGDNVRIDWGYLYLAVDSSQQTNTRIADSKSMLASFQKKGNLPNADDRRMPRPADENPIELAAVWNLGSVTDSPLDRHLMLAYDDIYSVEYFGKKLRAWWRNGGLSFEQMLLAADKDYEHLSQESARFDDSLYNEAKAAGGSQYAQLCALAYRQAIAAHKLVAGPDGMPLFFSKENFSNGSIGTVDITYPSAPLFLRYNPTLLKGMLEPIFYYSESGKWAKPFAAHDVGTYPLANGQTYGEDMPVEECGNMIILTTALAEVEGNADYAKKHWKVLTEWAQYLKKEGFDPANQLCTDDFAGHLARNANLSVKAIVALAGYGKLAEMLDDAATASEYQTLAKDLAQKWMQMADNGDHYALTFDAASDKKDTWSQKYNLVWDKLLRLSVFPAEVASKEVKYYLTKQQAYGLPLDSRRTYTKSDWITWTATLASRPEDFQQFIDPIFRFANETSDRIPLSDWHETTNGKSVGFRARSVVGGYFIKVLEKYLDKKRPDGKGQFGYDLAFLKRYQADVIVLSDEQQRAQVLLSPAYQGRVMSSTADGLSGMSYGWINYDLIASRKFLPHMNAFGGEDRFWMGPEGGQFGLFFKKDAPFDFDNWNTPAAIDTEPFEVVSKTNNRVTFKREMQVTNYKGTVFDVRVNREVRLLTTEEIGKMLRLKTSLSVKSVGFASTNTITNTGQKEWKPKTGMPSIWVLGMFTPSPATTIVVPYKAGSEDLLGPIVNDAYFGAIAANRLSVKPKALFFKGDGLQRGKIGIPFTRAKSVLGSYDAQNGVLTIVDYTLPKEKWQAYVNSMWQKQPDPYDGDVVNSYNDGPAQPGAKPMGPFYELESSSPAAALRPGQSISHLHRTFHFQGSKEDLDYVSRVVLGVPLDQIENALVTSQ